MSEKHILIVGTGSAGKRHGANFASLGCRISCVDPREDRLNELAEQIPLSGGFSGIEEALSSDFNFDGVAITSPPVFHVDQAIAALDRSIPVMLEKPVSPGAKEALRLQDAVRRTNVPLLLGYTYRWWPPLVKVRELLASKTVGDLRHVKFVMSAHLADWHPWENYQDFFMASKAMGGGALLDESHFVDLMLWFFGMPQTVMARIDQISDLEIDTDDNVDMIVEYDRNMRVTMHLDLFGRPHEKYIRFVGEKGTILWTMDPNQVAIASDWEGNWDITEFTCDRNDMFMGVDREFLEVLKGGQVSTCTIADGVDVLKVLDAARRSSESGQEVILGG